jgi:hypothetical protein
MASGAACFLRKPLEADPLIARLERAPSTSGKPMSPSVAVGHHTNG